MLLYLIQPDNNVELILSSTPCVFVKSLNVCVVLHEYTMCCMCE